MNTVYKFTVLFFSLLILQSCASGPKSTIAPVPIEDRSVKASPGGVGINVSIPGSSNKTAGGAMIDDRKNPVNTNNEPLVVALLDDADKKIKAGDKASAVATLERALRPEPKNAMLWHRLGLLRLQQKNWQQAINMALKSNSLAAGNYVLQASNWKLIAQANSRAGDKSAAKLAADMAIKLEQIQ